MTIPQEMLQISWPWVATLAPSGLIVAFISCFIGMKPKVENPTWWLLYLIWIAVAVGMRMPFPLLTLCMSSTFAGLLYGAFLAVFLNAYEKNNPWHAKDMTGPKRKWRLQFLLVGPFVGFIFGVVVGFAGWAILRFVVE